MSAELGVSMKRRQFLVASGALVVCAAAPWEAVQAATKPLPQVGSAAIPLKPTLDPVELDSWVAILPDGSVNAYFGKVDLGQGLEVGIAQIVADELDVRYEKVHVLMGDTNVAINQGGASSALGIAAGAKPMRNAAAEARRLMVAMASEKLNVPVEQLTVYDGLVAPRDNPSRGVTYADLVGGKYFNSKVKWNQKEGNELYIEGKAKPKSYKDYKVVGQSFPRNDVAWKAFGTDGFVSDVRVPNMLHARMVRTPHAGSTIVKVDASSIASIKGARVIQDKNFLAVVAEKEWDAVRGAQMLQVQWSEPTNPFPPQEKLYDHIRGAKVVKRDEEVKKGDARKILNAPGDYKMVEAEYHWPFQSHASMGPSCAVADVRKDQVTIWTGSQKPHYARDGIANLLNIKPEQVHAIWVVGAGSYGRNDAGDTVIDAAWLSKLTGRPVRVQGMRRDGTTWDPKAPASIHHGRAALDANGKVVAYEFNAKGFSRSNINSNESYPGDSLAGMEMGAKLKPGNTFGVPAEAYTFENKSMAWETIPPLLERASPLRTAHMRDPVGPQTHFASEQFIDELAAAAKTDPVAFRLQNLKDGRDKAIIKAVADKSGWQPAAAPRMQRDGDLLLGRGIAYAQRSGTFVAVVSEIEVNPKSGRIWVRKFTVGHDCGIVVNPRQLHNVIEGALIQGMSRGMYEEVQFTPDMVSSVDWMTYRIVDMVDIPGEVDIVMLNRPEASPTGAAEATSRVVPASIANAFFDATGVRLRRAPLSPENVLAVLKA
ncbi:MAG TPA: molybdopterin cofactor-binding domain-containing protein [Herbaspirillum sp.]